MNAPNWEQQYFLVEFDKWIERDRPSEEWRIGVLAWIHSLLIEPKRHAKADSALGEPWWFAIIPDASNDREAAICFYVVDEDRHRLQCVSIATLRLPI